MTGSKLGENKMARVELGCEINKLSSVYDECGNTKKYESF